MNQYQITKRYLQTLKQVYQEKGLKAAVKHELISTIGSFVGWYARADNYFVIFTQNDRLPDSKDFQIAKRYNQKIKAARLENILNPNLSSDLWITGSWTEKLI